MHTQHNLQEPRGTTPWLETAGMRGGHVIELQTVQGLFERKPAISLASAPTAIVQGALPQWLLQESLARRLTANGSRKDAFVRVCSFTNPQPGDTGTLEGFGRQHIHKIPRR